MRSPTFSEDHPLRALLVSAALVLSLAGMGCDETAPPTEEADPTDLQLVDLGHGLVLTYWLIEERPNFILDVTYTFGASLAFGRAEPRELMVSIASDDESMVIVDGNLRFPAGAGVVLLDALDEFRIRVDRDHPFDPRALRFRALDRFGGDLDKPTTATGRFRLEELDGRHWFVTPEGHAFFSAGINHVTFAGDYSPPIDRRPYNEAALARYGDEDSWAEATVDRLLGWNLNTIGAWSNDSVEERMPHTVVLSLNRAGPEITGWPGGQTGQRIRDYFDPAFLTQLASRAEAARPCAENPSCIGVYSDNELPLGRSVLQFGTYVDAYLTLPPNAPGKLELQTFFEERYAGDIDAMNAVWSLELASFDDIQALSSLEDDSEFCARDQRRADRQAFTAVAAAAYFEAVHDALRAISPDLLILGTRMLGVYTAPSIIEAAAPFVDVISINDYDWDANGRGLFRSEGEPYGYLFLDDPISDLAEVHRLSGRPLMITEWTVRTPTPDVDVLFPPFLPTVDTQSERADRYEAFMRALIERPYVVGSHWFKFHDQPPTGRGDGENSLFGAVNIDDDPYRELTERMAAVGASIYDPPSGGELSETAAAEIVAPLGRRTFTPSQVEDERTGFFVFILPDVNVAGQMQSDPLLLDAGAPDALGIAPLSLAEDATLAYHSVIGDIACLRLRAEGSHGEIACEGGVAHDVRVTSSSGDIPDAPVVERFIGADAGPGAATLLASFEFTQLPSGAALAECWTTDTWQPAYPTALTTSTITSIKGETHFDIQGENFVCGRSGEDWRTEDGPGMFAIGVPLFDGRVPDGDLAAAFRAADSEVGCR